MVIPVLSPPTVHLKVMVSPGQVGGDAVNCPATLSADNQLNYNRHKSIHGLDLEEQWRAHTHWLTVYIYIVTEFRKIFHLGVLWGTCNVSGLISCLGWDWGYYYHRYVVSSLAVTTDNSFIHSKLALFQISSCVAGSTYISESVWKCSLTWALQDYSN